MQARNFKRKAILNDWNEKLWRSKNEESSLDDEKQPDKISTMKDPIPSLKIKNQSDVLNTPSDLDFASADAESKSFIYSNIVEEQDNCDKKSASDSDHENCSEDNTIEFANDNRSVDLNFFNDSVLTDSDLEEVKSCNKENHMYLALRKKLRVWAIKFCIVQTIITALLMIITASLMLFRIEVMCFIFDTPARCFIENIISFNGYYGCERSTEKGRKIEGCTIFSSVNEARKTDDSFRKQEQPQHHTGTTPLLKIIPAINMIFCFPLDFMHLCCLHR